MHVVYGRIRLGIYHEKCNDSTWLWQLKVLLFEIYGMWYIIQSIHTDKMMEVLSIEIES